MLPLHGGSFELSLVRTVSGADWCREQASNQPFLTMVDEAAVGGPAWPQARAASLVVELGHTTVTGGIAADRLTVIDALRPGVAPPPASVNRPVVLAARIAPQTVPSAQAAARRLDAYCEAHAR